MTANRQEESPPVLTVEEPQVGVEALGLGALRDETTPGQEAAGLSHETGELGGEEAADQERLDGEQHEHCGDHSTVYLDRGDNEDEPQQQKKGLRDGARGLGDDDRRHALVIRHGRPQEPDLDRLPAD
jgi:hypothetical protein